MSNIKVPNEPVKKEEVKTPTAQTTKLVEHHRQAEIHHTNAAKYNGEVVKHHTEGNTEKAAESAKKAKEHHELAYKHQQEIDKTHANKSL
jgi:hypothetical protein